MKIKMDDDDDDYDDDDDDDTYRYILIYTLCIDLRSIDGRIRRSRNFEFLRIILQVNLFRVFHLLFQA